MDAYWEWSKFQKERKQTSTVSVGWPTVTAYHQVDRLLVRHLANIEKKEKKSSTRAERD